jgi:SnoaL-like protein
MSLDVITVGRVLLLRGPERGVPARQEGERKPMSDEQTLKVIEQFNQAFHDHDPNLLKDLLAEDCVLENSGPAPDGSRHEGYAACLEFWSQIAGNTQATFEPEEVWVAGDRAVCRWRLQWGPGASDFIRGVNVTKLRDGLIVESMGYVKG